MLDANAIIGRSVLQPLADRSVSTAEVLAECRDRATQDSLAALPYEIAVQEPGEESIQQGLPLVDLCGRLGSKETFLCSRSVYKVGGES